MNWSDFLKLVFELLKNNPQAIGDLLEIIKRVLDLFEKYPDLRDATVAALKKGSQPQG